jgi:hypothetical protein
MRKHTTLVGVVLLALACDLGSRVADIPVRVDLTPALDTVLVNQPFTGLVARAFNASDQEIPDPTIRWSSTAPSVAAVDSATGVVTGLRAGTAEVIARAGLVTDTAEIAVVNVLQVALALDTILLAPGDTFTILAAVQTFDGSPPPPTVFRGGAPTIATIDSMTGLVTAVGPGSVPFSADVDTVHVTGQVAVLQVADTVFGALQAAFEGSIQAQFAFGARAFNHPNDFGGSMFQIAASTADELVALVFVDSLGGTTTRSFGTLTPADIGAGTDPICRPTTSFGYFRQDPTGIIALSIQGGTLYARVVGPVPGGQALSGRFDLSLQRTDIEGEAGRTRMRGTFVVPLVSLASCPK